MVFQGNMRKVKIVIKDNTVKQDKESSLDKLTDTR
jgi:hypothetical protein